MLPYRRLVLMGVLHLGHLFTQAKQKSHLIKEMNVVFKLERNHAKLFASVRIDVELRGLRMPFLNSINRDTFYLAALRTTQEINIGRTQAIDPSGSLFQDGFMIRDQVTNRPYLFNCMLSLS